MKGAKQYFSEAKVEAVGTWKRFTEALAELGKTTEDAATVCAPQQRTKPGVYIKNLFS